MIHKEIYDPEKYDLRDSYWKFLSVKEGEPVIAMLFAFDSAEITWDEPCPRVAHLLLRKIQKEE